MLNVNHLILHQSPLGNPLNALPTAGSLEHKVSLRETPTELESTQFLPPGTSRSIYHHSGADTDLSSACTKELPTEIIIQSLLCAVKNCVKEENKDLWGYIRNAPLAFNYM